jgi:hypothetical protein
MKIFDKVDDLSVFGVNYLVKYLHYYYFLTSHAVLILHKNISLNCDNIRGNSWRSYILEKNKSSYEIIVLG